MNKVNSLASAVALAIALPGAVMAMDLEISGYLKNETAVFTGDAKPGEMTGNLQGHDAGDLMKFENSARIFINGEVGEASSWHADLNLIYDLRSSVKPKIIIYSKVRFFMRQCDFTLWEFPKREKHVALHLW